MFLKKVDGPRAVTLPDGRVLTLADLPEPATRRWVASRKETVVRAVWHGMLSRQAAMERYDLSDEELSLWETSVRTDGVQALKITKLRDYRQPMVE